MNVKGRLFLELPGHCYMPIMKDFCKFAFTVYYDELIKLDIPLRKLPERIQYFALRSKIKKLKNLEAIEIISAIRNFEDNYLDLGYEFPEVETNSNLWPKTLSELLLDANLAIPSLIRNERTISTLVNRRNKIAHGEQDSINDYEYYVKHEEAVKTIFYELVFAIDERLALASNNFCPY